MISVVVALTALVVGANQAWPIVGWTTPNQHDADFLATTEVVKDFRDEWKCDEYQEELIELLTRQATGDDTIALTEKITRLRDRIAKLDCQRFEN